MPITFRNHATNVPNWEPIHVDQPRSYAYRKGTSIVSIYGHGKGLYVLSPGLTVSEVSQEELADWADRVFAASDLEVMLHAVGETVAGVWRPGMPPSDTNQALKVTDAERLASDQALHILMEKLHDLFRYVEPVGSGLAAYGHRTRELLILAATEVENYWKRYAALGGIHPAGKKLTTSDYVRLRAPLYLEDYEIRLHGYPEVGPIRPFLGWASEAPTQSLPWYHAYNQTKHDRDAHFAEASVFRCIEAVAACIVLFAVRFSPFSLIEGRSISSTQFNQLFSIGLAEPDARSFYVPDVAMAGRSPLLVCGRGKVEPWTVLPLVIP